MDDMLWLTSLLIFISFVHGFRYSFNFYIFSQWHNIRPIVASVASFSFWCLFHLGCRFKIQWLLYPDLWSQGMVHIINLLVSQLILIYSTCPWYLSKYLSNWYLSKSQPYGSGVTAGHQETSILLGQVTFHVFHHGHRSNRTCTSAGNFNLSTPLDVHNIFQGMVYIPRYTCTFIWIHWALFTNTYVFLEG